MRHFINKIVITILVIAALVIFAIVAQQALDEGKALRFFDSRVLISEADYKDYQIDKYDLIIVKALSSDKIKKDQVVAFYTRENKYDFAKIKEINDTTIVLEKADSSVVNLSVDEIEGLYYKEKIPKIGRFILYVRTTKGFFISLGIIFAAIIILSVLEKIIFQIKKLFTKKDRNTTVM